jgi:hypothetical protein
VLDAEHAYTIDFVKGAVLDAFVKNINWDAPQKPERVDPDQIALRRAKPLSLLKRKRPLRSGRFFSKGQ